MKFSCSMKYADQDTGEDLDPNFVKWSVDCNKTFHSADETRKVK